MNVWTNTLVRRSNGGEVQLGLGFPHSLIVALQDYPLQLSWSQLLAIHSRGSLSRFEELHLRHAATRLSGVWLPPRAIGIT